jgi:hypothetical protein
MSAVGVAAAVLAAGLGVGAPWIFEVLAGVGLLVGVGAAFGAFDLRGERARRWTGHARRRPVASRSLTEAVDAQLHTLDQVEHRRLDLGDPWPVVIVGPTGVTVVAVADRIGVRTVARAREVAEVARDLAAARPSQRRVAVATVLVLPDGQAAPPPLERARLTGIATVGVRDLPDVLARGPLVPMATVIAIFAQLSSRLGSDLRVEVG